MLSDHSPPRSPNILDTRPVPVTEYHPTSGYILNYEGKNILQKMDDDQYAYRRIDNHFYPFKDRQEWELGRFLCSSSLKQNEIDDFLKLPWTRKMGPSFKSYHALESMIESLPSGPIWRSETIIVDGYITKTPITFIYWDAAEVIDYIFGNPVFAHVMEMDPRKVFTDTDRDERVYTQFMTGDHAWACQDNLPLGATLVGVVGASDKTCVTSHSGGLQMHPAFLSIANIDGEVRMKASSHAWLCTAFMPIPDFEVHADYQSILADRVWHACMDICTVNLKKGAREGRQMSDPYGNTRLCFTPLVGYTADLPEQLLIHGVTKAASPITEATTQNFGDHIGHHPRLGSKTLERIHQLCQKVDPWDLDTFQKAAKALNLNGVHLPFWRDWHQSDPSVFLVPEILHSCHKFFFDHVLTWCKTLVGVEELDLRFKVLPVHSGYRHFAKGICHVQQMTGREHREIQRTIVAVIAGAVPPQFLRAIRAIIDFIYQVQAPRFTDSYIRGFVEALDEFHEEKEIVLQSGARCGKHGPKDHMNLPKLEVLHGFARSIQLVGASIFHSADVSERLLITHCKHPFLNTNHRNFEEQTVRNLDRQEKMRMFELYTLLRGSQNSLVNLMSNEASTISKTHPQSTWMAQILPNEKVVGALQAVCNLFLKGLTGTASNIAFHLNVKPDIATLSLTEAASQYNLPDLPAAMADYARGLSHLDRQGCRQSTGSEDLGFDRVRIWSKFKVQTTSVHNSDDVIPVQTVHAHPPGDRYPYGRCDTVLCGGTDKGNVQASDVAQVRIIFQPISRDASVLQSAMPILLYAQKFKFAGKFDENGILLEEPNIDMYLLRRLFRSQVLPNGKKMRMGDVMAISDVLHPVYIVPVFGKIMDRRINCDNSMELPDMFYLNNFSDKETHHNFTYNFA
ncbi:hypothetical protein FIBSPDRAFT_751423 [Athelia psychrophila]|uniref:DUF6830 domain-containing protein n=1 Tax=Athelia psychrophila TaxID=1759441 RepID=A0A166DI85_9AGAM|nr:hypothetical protein FIBSPDRAFT_751423 [Fibularhizoctonia sp. CBS 109695]